MSPSPSLRGRTSALLAAAAMLFLSSCTPSQPASLVGATDETARAPAALAHTAQSAERAPGSPTTTPAPPVVATAAPPCPHDKIKHVVVVIQENRSFDNYFGLFPGADGIPLDASGQPAVCVPDPQTKSCVRPFHNPKDVEEGGPHSAVDAAADIDGGKMDGFIRQQDDSRRRACLGAAVKLACERPGGVADVMGYHDAREIPNYWTYARQFVLLDHLFQPNASWSLPSHLFLVSAWSARCRTSASATCRNEIQDVEAIRDGSTGGDPAAQPYAWTDLTYLLRKANVSWAYYVAEGTQPDCTDDGMACQAKPQRADFDTLVSPLPRFQTVHDDHQVGNIQPISRFYQAARDGTLPAVAWIVPDEPHSEHPPSSIHAGQAYVTGLINAIMQGPNWNSTAILVTWDDWGGFYDHVVPPTVNQNGYGLRVPGLMISPDARRGSIDHQILSFDAFLKLIEDLSSAASGWTPPLTGGRTPVPRGARTRPSSAICCKTSTSASRPARRWSWTPTPRPGRRPPTRCGGSDPAERAGRSRRHRLGLRGLQRPEYTAEQRGGQRLLQPLQRACRPRRQPPVQVRGEEKAGALGAHAPAGRLRQGPEAGPADRKDPLAPVSAVEREERPRGPGASIAHQRPPDPGDPSQFAQQRHRVVEVEQQPDTGDGIAGASRHGEREGIRLHQPVGAPSRRRLEHRERGVEGE